MVEVEVKYDRIKRKFGSRYRKQFKPTPIAQTNMIVTLNVRNQIMIPYNMTGLMTLSNWQREGNIKFSSTLYGIIND